MQKESPAGFDPQRFPKDLLILMLSYAAENTCAIALVCKLWSHIVVLERYWHHLVDKRLKDKLKGMIDEKRMANINVFSNAPYDIKMGQIRPLTLRERLGWMFDNVGTISKCEQHNASPQYNCYFIVVVEPNRNLLLSPGIGMRWT